MNDFNRNDRFGGKRTGGGFGKKPFGKPAYGGRPGFSRSQTTMYPATCAQCGNACEVPFRPDGQRPVYCRDCLGGNKAPTPSRESQRPAFRQPAPAPAPVITTDPRIDAMQGQLAKILVKLDQILLGMAVSKAQATVIPSPVKEKTKKGPKKK